MGISSGKRELPAACRRVVEAASDCGLEIEILLMDQSTRTAEEAAETCGTSVGQIVKSLVFQKKESGSPVLLLVSGSNTNLRLSKITSWPGASSALLIRTPST